MTIIRLFRICFPQMFVKHVLDRICHEGSREVRDRIATFLIERLKTAQSEIVETSEFERLVDSIRTCKYLIPHQTMDEIFDRYPDSIREFPNLFFEIERRIIQKKHLFQKEKNIRCQLQHNRKGMPPIEMQKKREELTEILKNQEVF